MCIILIKTCSLHHDCLKNLFKNKLKQNKTNQLEKENKKYKEVIDKVKELIIDNIEETTYEYIGLIINLAISLFFGSYPEPTEPLYIDESILKYNSMSPPIFVISFDLIEITVPASEPDIDKNGL